jgi:transcriptional regulator with XRE-family HTH domain
MTDMRFAQKLEKLLSERGWNKAILADRVGVSRNTAGRWVNGDSLPFDPVLVTLAEEMGVTVDYLINEKIESPSVAAPCLSEDEAYKLRLLRDAGISGAELFRLLVRHVTESDPRPDPPRGQSSQPHA